MFHSFNNFFCIESHFVPRGDALNGDSSSVNAGTTTENTWDGGN